MVSLRYVIYYISEKLLWLWSLHNIQKCIRLEKLWKYENINEKICKTVVAPGKLWSISWKILIACELFCNSFRQPHSKKNRNFTEPPKNVRQIWKRLEMCWKFEKTNKKIYETFKGSFPGHTGRSFFSQNLFKFRRGKKWICRYIRNLQSFLLNITVLYKTQCETMRLNTKIWRFCICLQIHFFAQWNLKRFWEKKDLPVCLGKDPLKVS
jgi:hypothetical protein